MRFLKMAKENSTNKSEETAQGQQLDVEDTKQFWSKIWQPTMGNRHTERMKLQKEFQIGKHQAMMTFMDYDFKNSCPCKHKGSAIE